MDAVPTPPAGGRPIRVLVVDAAATARRALRLALAADVALEVVGEADDAVGGLHLCVALAPDVVVGDLGTGPSGEDAVRRMTSLHPPVQVLVVTPCADGDTVRGVLDAGAVGYLLDDVDPVTLRDGVHAVARGESPLDPRAVRAMLRARPAVRGEDLTARERQVLALVMRGLANKQIARELQITDGTVKAHLGSIFTRIGVTDRTSAALWAERNLRADRVPLPVPGPGEDVGPGWSGRGPVLQSATA